jgi:hypothetical protein
METITITAEDLDPVVSEAKRLGVPAYRLMAGSKLWQVRQAFRTAYGAEIEREHCTAYYSSIGYKVCSKCGGSGKYIMAMVDGRPWSTTGTTCWKCDGSEWVKSKRAKSK